MAKKSKNTEKTEAQHNWNAETIAFITEKLKNFAVGELCLINSNDLKPFYHNVDKDFKKGFGSVAKHKVLSVVKNLYDEKNPRSVVKRNSNIISVGKELKDTFKPRK